MAGATLIANPAAAQEVGTATAVNPTSESTPPGGSTQTLTIGAHIIHKEHIHTSPSGSVQLLFLDKSSLSIAPNTSIVIDEFIYDPNSGKGHMLTTLTQGALRYVGGELVTRAKRQSRHPTRPSASVAGLSPSAKARAAPRSSTNIGAITISNNGGHDRRHDARL